MPLPWPQPVSSPLPPPGTNYKLKLKVEGGAGTKYYEAKVWGEAPLLRPSH